jgi:tetratricopeptide (TPR) repeat protein
MNRKPARSKKRKAGPSKSASAAKSLAALFADGVKCHQAGELAKAVALYDRILSLKHALPEVHSNRGVALASLGKLADAEAAHRRAIALNPNFADAYNNLGSVLLNLGKFEASEDALRQAIALKPHFPEAFSNLGNTLKEQGRLSEAEAAYRSAIALNPHFAPARNNLGNVLIDLGELHAAEQTLRHTIVLQPQCEEAFSNLGKALREQHRLTEAEAACRHAIELNPDHPEAHNNLGNVLMDQGRLTDAEAAYRVAIGLKPDFAIAYNNLGAALKQLGRLADGRRAVERAIQIAPRNPLLFLNLGDFGSFVAGDPFMTAMGELAEGMASLPISQQIELHFALAKAYQDVGLNEKSFRELLAGNALKRSQIPYDEVATFRAFEHIQKVFTPERMRWLQDSGNPSSVPVYIVGMPRSGTTLIEQILASHPQVFGAGELSNFGDIAAGIFPSSDDGCAFPEVMLSMSRERLRRVGERYVSEIIHLSSNAAHIIDKMPLNFLFVGLIHLALPNARIIHAVRDPVDTCVSCFARLFDAGQYHTYDLAELGRYYRHYRALMEHWHNVLPAGRILDVRYEEVVADLEAQARRIVAHCELQWDPRCLAFHETDRPVRTASAAQVRRPLYRSAIGRSRIYHSFLTPLRAALEEL